MRISINHAGNRQQDKSKWRKNNIKTSFKQIDFAVWACDAELRHLTSRVNTWIRDMNLLRLTAAWKEDKPAHLCVNKHRAGGETSSFPSPTGNCNKEVLGSVYMAHLPYSHFRSNFGESWHIKLHTDVRYSGLVCQFVRLPQLRV